jgi:serine/threonine protein kinase
MEMVRNEIEWIKDLDHPNIVKVYDYGEEEGRFYMILELAPAKELFTYLQLTSEFSEEVVRYYFR